MRVLALVLLSFFISFAPAAAQDMGHSFGSAYCQQKIPCPDAPEVMSNSDMAAVANTCLSKSFGLNSVDGMFDEYGGLDSSGCLASKQPAGTGKHIVPSCCMTKLPDNTCTFRCQLISH